MAEPSQPGIQRCMKCRWLFVSPDEERIRRCHKCKKREDSYEPRTASVQRVEVAVHSHLKVV